MVLLLLVALLSIAGACTAESTPRDMKPPKGSFLQLDGGNLKYTRAQWETELQAMKDLGMDTLIVGEVARNDYTFCRLSGYPLWKDCGTKDPLQTLLDISDKLGFKVFVGIYAYDWNKQKPEDFEEHARKCVAIADDVWKTYGKHKAFAGWYALGWEVGNIADETNPGVQAYMKVIPHLRKISPDVPIMTAPYFTLDITPAAFEEGWKKLLPLLDVDILALQDGVGCARKLTPDNIKPYFAAMSRVCRKEKVRFWADVETFDILPTGNVPAPVDRIVAQMKAVSPYVEKIVFFEYNHYLSPVKGLKGSSELADAINRYACK